MTPALKAQIEAVSLQKLASLVIRHTDNEITSYPVWAIVSKGGLGNMIWHSGPWFNREDADKHLEEKAHRYPKKSFVYCYSGHMSWHYKELFDAARHALTALASIEAGVGE